MSVGGDRDACAQGMPGMCGTHSLRLQTTPGGRCQIMP